MNALRNLSARTLTYLLNGQNALINVAQPVVDNNSAAAAPPTTTSNVVKRPKQPLLIPKSLLDATSFAGKKIDAAKTSSGSVSPTTLKRYRRMERKVELVYRCKICNTRNSKLVSEAAYTSGIVILQCDGCTVNHLIRDNLGWFTKSNGKSFDQVLAEKGERIKVIKVNEHGDLI